VKVAAGAVLAVVAVTVVPTVGLPLLLLAAVFALPLLLLVGLVKGVALLV